MSTEPVTCPCGALTVHVALRGTVYVCQQCGEAVVYAPARSRVATKEGT